MRKQLGRYGATDERQAEFASKHQGDLIICLSVARNAPQPTSFGGGGGGGRQGLTKVTNAFQRRNLGLTLVVASLAARTASRRCGSVSLYSRRYLSNGSDTFSDSERALQTSLHKRFDRAR